MQVLLKLLITLYFFLCPAEMALNVIFGSTAKYVGMAIFGVWGLSVFAYGRDALIKLTKHNTTLLLWLFYCVMSLAWADTSSRTNVYLTTYIQMGALFFICTQGNWTKKEINLYLTAYYFGSIIMAAATLFFGDSEFSGRGTITVLGRFCDPNQVAANILPGVFISFNQLVKKSKKNSSKALHLLAIAVTAFAVFYTGSRGGLVSLLIGMFLLVTINLISGTLQIRYGILIALVGIIAIMQLPKETSSRLLEFDSYTETYSNGGNRLTIWASMLKDFDAQWFVGHGVGSTISYFYQIYGELKGVHNTFLLVLYEVGFVGLFFFLFPFASLGVYHFCRRNALYAAVLAGALAGSFFLDALNLRYIWNALMLCTMYYNYEQLRC